MTIQFASGLSALPELKGRDIFAGFAAKSPSSCQPNRQARSQDRRFDRGSRAPHRLEERHDRLVPPRLPRRRQDHQHGGRHPCAHGLQGPDACLVLAAILQLRSDRAHQIRRRPPHLFLGNARQAGRGDLQRPDGRTDQHPLPWRPGGADPERRDRHRRRLPGRVRLRFFRQRQWRFGAFALRFARLRHGRCAIRPSCRVADRGDRSLPEYAGFDPSGSGRLDRQGRSRSAIPRRSPSARRAPRRTRASF